ncbi:MAG: hypothetical protein LBU07_07165 [Coriobacteriales bacterium]|jgi:hypothetical protein|nr:hypothetical protein [Coriobacteriales bacterium]
MPLAHLQQQPYCGTADAGEGATAGAAHLTGKVKSMDTEKGPEPIDTQAGSQWQLSLMPQDLMKALVLGIGLSALAILGMVICYATSLFESLNGWGMFRAWFVLVILWPILMLLCISLLCFYTRREVSKSNAHADGAPTKKGKRILVTWEGIKLFFVFLTIGVATPLLPLFHWFNSEAAGTIFALVVVIVASLWALRVFYCRVVKTKRAGYITLAA